MMYPDMAFVTARSLILAIPDASYSAGERLAFCSYIHVAQVDIYEPSRVA